MKKVKLEAVFINEKKKDGSFLINSKGQRYKTAVIRFEGQQASIYLKQEKEDIIKQWKVGDEVKIKTSTNDQGFLVFNLPDKADLLEEKLCELNESHKLLESRFNKLVFALRNKNIV